MRGIWVRVRVSFGAQSGHFAAESGEGGRGKGSCGTSTVLLGYSGCILFFGFYVNRLFYICYEDLQFYLFCTTRRFFLFNLLILVWLGGFTVSQSVARDQRSGVRDQRSEIRDQGSEIRDQGSGIRDQRSEIRDQGSEIRDQGSGIRDQRSEIRDQGSGIRGQGSEIRGQRSEIRGQGSEIRDQGSGIRGRHSCVISFLSNPLPPIPPISGNKFLVFKGIEHGLRCKIFIPMKLFANS
jgi:hypothetical protein